MDFCASDHCRSVLSPAAYLVDLLRFIDRDPTDDGKKNPQLVLLERRPDIQHLPLTCENTNTPLPYIDLVNEILEYFITNGAQPPSLQGYMGHDTGEVTSEDLMANPQFVLDAAYTILRRERFPMPLPFHRPLEYLRRFFDKFEVPLSLAMERLRKTNDLERGTNPYGWRDILMEAVGLSPEEYEILTDSAAVPLWRMYGFPNGTGDPVVIAALSNAKLFARRVGISYDELISLLQTRFINPHTDLIPKLERLGVPFATLQALHDGTISDDEFDALLPTGEDAPDPIRYDGDIKAWVKNEDNFKRIMAIITLADPANNPDGCDFGKLEMRFTRPTIDPDDNRLGSIEYTRLLRFIRLWRKTGWTIEQTDAAICALYRTDLAPLGPDDIDTIAKLDAGLLILLPRIGIVVRVMNALNLTADRDLLSLLACWSDITTHGNHALYRQMFLNPVVLSQDTIFADDGYGAFLQNATVQYSHPQATLEQPILDAAQCRIGYDHSTQQLSYYGVLDTTTRDALKAVPGVSVTFQAAVDTLFAAQRLLTHAATLQAAFHITAEEFERIFVALGFDGDTALTIANISHIYRRGWLARKLRLSVRELLLLTSLTSLDPFVLPDPTHPAILRLIALVQTMKEQSLKTAAALYFIWNQDLSGKSAPKPARVSEFVRTLRGDFAAIDDEFAVTEDP
jgi:hypothetical protein